MLKGLSTLTENEVSPYSACPETHTRPMDSTGTLKTRHEYSATCYPSTREDQELKVIISYLGSLKPAGVT